MKATTHIIIALGIGYASHILADLITPQGIPLWLPLSDKRIKVPLVPTGGVVEQILAIALVILCLMMINGSL